MELQTAEELVAALRAGAVTSVELTDEAIARIERDDEVINTICVPDSGRARAAPAEPTRHGRVRTGHCLGTSTRREPYVRGATVHRHVTRSGRTITSRRQVLRKCAFFAPEPKSRWQPQGCVSLVPKEYVACELDVRRSDSCRLIYDFLNGVRDEADVLPFLGEHRAA